MRGSNASGGVMARQGWEKLPGSSERYRSPSGEIVSRRQYDNARYTDTGWRNRADYERRHSDPTYRHFQQIAMRQLGLTRRQVESPDSEFAKRILKARAVDYGKGRRGRGAKGPMAKFLVWLKMRDPGADFPVGAS